MPNAVEAKSLDDQEFFAAMAETLATLGRAIASLEQAARVRAADAERAQRLLVIEGGRGDA